MSIITRRQFLTVSTALFGTSVLSACLTTGPVVRTTAPTTPVYTVSIAKAQGALNALRREHGLRELIHNPVLQAVAEEQAGIMARTGVVAHTAAPDETFIKRLRRADFWGGAGENLAGGTPNLTIALDGWMTSRGHREVLLNPEYVQFGIAVRRGANTPTNTYGSYWALIMGVMSPEMRARLAAQQG